MITDTELLEKIREAIVDILTTGQSHKIGDMEYNKANISSLYKMEERLLNNGGANEVALKYVEVIT